MTVTIVFSSQSLKITTGRDALIEKWGTLQVPPGLIKDGLILDTTVVGKQIKTYFDTEHLPRKEVVVSLTGASYVYRLLRLPHLPAKRLREAIERATQKEINLDLVDLYIDWDIIRDSDGETEVFVTGIPRRSIEALIQTLNIAGIKPLKIGLSSLALARAVDQYETLLVNFDPECFDIAIITGGIPVTLHSILPRNREANLQDQILQLTDELTRTIDFYNLTHKDHMILPGASLVLSGSLAAEPAAADSITKILGYPVNTLKMEIAYPPDFPFSYYSINVGLALKINIPKFKNTSRGQVYRDIDIDLLRARRRTLAHPISIRQILIPTGLALAAILLFPAIININQCKAQSATLQLELAAAVHQLNERQTTLEQESELLKTIAALNEETNNIHSEKEVATGRGDLNQMIKTLTGYLPSGARYSDIACDTKQITVDGLADDRATVISYARALEKSRIFSLVRIGLIDETPVDNNTPDTVFRLIIER